MSSSVLSQDTTSFRSRFKLLPYGFLFLVFILFPVAHLPVLGFPVYWSELALLGAMASAPLIGWVQLRKRWVSVVSEWRPLLFFSGLFLCGIFVAFFSNPHALSGWGELKSFYILPIFLLVSLLIFGETRRQLECFLSAWLLGTVAAALAALGAASMGWVLYDGRLASAYLSPNYLAMLVTPGVLLALYFSLVRIDRTARWVGVLSLIVLLPVLWATHSYAAWLSLIVALGVFLGLGKSSPKLLLKICILVALVASIFLIRESRTEKWNAILSGSDRSSLASRVMIWRSARQIVHDSLPWGVGVGRFQEMYLAAQPLYPPYLEWAVPTPHNLYLHFLIEGGLLALIGWLGSVSVVFMAVWKRWKQSRPKQLTAFGALAISLLIFYLVYGLIDTPYMKNDLALAIWGALGLLARSSRF